MAGSKTRLSLKEVRTGLKGIQTEGERLLSRIRRDPWTSVVRSSREAFWNFLANAREFQADLRQRAERVIRDLDTRRRHILPTLEEQASRLIDAIGSRLNVASRDELGNLHARVIELRERLDALANVTSTPSRDELADLHERIAALEQKLAALTVENASKVL